MKLHLPTLLRKSLLACIAALSSASAFTATGDLGGTMFVGDSITHGTESKSYRWELHKLFVDNGITYTEVGIQYDNTRYPNGVSNRDLVYGSSVWQNYHAAMFAEHAAEISGRGLATPSGRLGNTNIRQWLNLAEGGNYHIDASTTPSTYFMLIGTNDLLGTSHRAGAYLEELQANLLGTKTNGLWSGTGDMDAIIDAMRDKSGSDVDIVLLTVPTLYVQGKNGAYTEADLLGMREYNKALAEWAEWKGVTLVQSDKGIIDVAAPEEWKEQGVSSMFRGGSDFLHPNAQGDLLIAGNVAKALGYAGHTAGQARMKAESFNLQATDLYTAATRSGSLTQSGSSMTLGTGASLSYAWESSPTGGFTVDFTLNDGIGNGAADGWNTSDHFSISIGDGNHGGTLNINEAYIQWGDYILYSIDTSEGLDSLRVAYVYGNSAKGLASGFYVWLGDQLIGQGLASEGNFDGLAITNGSGSDVTLSDLVLDADGSWAPWSDGFSVSNPLIAAIGDSPYGDFPGRKEWCSNNMIKQEGVVWANNVRANIVSDGIVGGYVTSGTATDAVFMNQGEYEGDLYITLTGTANATSYWGFHGYRGPGVGQPVTFRGNGYLRVQDLNDQRTFKTFIAVANAKTAGLDGDMYFEMSSENLTLQGQSFNNIVAAITGVYNSQLGITGEFRVVINAGEIQAPIIGGSINGEGSVGSVAIFINGGRFESGAVDSNTSYSNIAAGGFLGSVGNRSITITGDAMSLTGCQYITAGSVNADNKEYFVVGNANPTATVKADSTATVTIADATQEGGFGVWEGTLSGGEECAGRSLIFSNTVLEELKATITNFDNISLGSGSKVGLKSLGGATVVMIGDGCVLTVLEDMQASTLDNMGKVVVSSGATLTVDGVEGTDMLALVGTYVLEGGSLRMGSATNGGYDVEVSDISSLSLASGAKGVYTVKMEKDSELTLSADGFAGDISLSMSGSGTVSADSVGSASLSVDDSAAVGQGTFTLGGGLSITEITLTQLSGGSQVTGIAGDGALTLSGESSIVLTASMQNATGAMLLTNRALAMGDGATLKIDVNSIVDEVRAAKGTAVAYYLTQGDLSALANAGVVFDATLAALGWEVEYGTDGALRFTAYDKSGIYDSSQNNNGSAWGADGENIYVSVDKYDAVLVNSDTHIDLSAEDVPTEYQEDGLMVKNLVGTDADAELSITGKPGEPSRVTISNTISAEQRKKLEHALGVDIEDSLTFAGNITITDAELQIKHVDPDLGEGKADSTTIVKGNLTLVGNDGLTMTSGVLRLEGTNNTLGSGDVRFAGNDGQIVVATGAKLSVGGALALEDGKLDVERTEHVLIERKGNLTLDEGSSVGSEVTIGNEDATQVGQVTVLGSQVEVAQDSRLAHVTLQVDGGLVITPSQKKAVSAAWDLEGLSGSGSISGAVEKDMRIAVAEKDHVFSGNLENYRGTMTFLASKYTQYFVGVQGGSGWNVTNEAGGHVVFDLASNSGSNVMTMGKLTLERGSWTSILLDLGRTSTPTGLMLSELEVTADANITIGQYKGLVTLEGEKGSVVTLAVITISGDDHDFDKVKEGVKLTLQGVRNAENVDFLYSAEDKTLSLITYIEDTFEYISFASGANSIAGAMMFGALQNSYLLGGDLAAMDEAVFSLLRGSARLNPGNVAMANKIMAAAAGASVTVMGQAFHDDVERQLHAIRNRTTFLSFDDPAHSGVNMWLNSEGSYHKLDAVDLLPGYKLNSWGGTVGAAAGLGRGVGVGMAITAMYGDLESAGPDRLKGDMNTYYVTAFLSASRAAWRHTLLATVGHAQMDMNRTVDYGTGSYTTESRTSGSAFGLMYELGYSLPLNKDWSSLLQPVVNVSFRHTRLGGYHETGSTNAKLSVGAQEQNSVTFGVGARVQSIIGANLWNRFGILEARALLKARTGDDYSSASVAFRHVNSGQQKVESAAIGSLGVELGAGISVPISSEADIFADASVELWSGYTNANATIGFKFNF